jgi:DNA-directed RNA polymerase specialized sigma24 family protein
MGREEYTSIGGDERRFQTTHWTAVEAVRSGEPSHAQRLIGELLDAYWKPVYCYLRRRGYRNEEAKDLTQEFFQEVVLGRELIQQADRAKGRFRTLLLRALDRYLVSVHRRTTARKRTPPARVVLPEDRGLDDLPAAVDGLDDQDIFNYAWITALLDKMLAEVRVQCVRRGMGLHWTLFYERVVQPILEDREPPGLTALCARHGIEEPTRASNMIFSVKRQFQAALQQHLRDSVARDDDVAGEIGDLVEFLTRFRQDRG